MRKRKRKLQGVIIRNAYCSRFHFVNIWTVMADFSLPLPSDVLGQYEDKYRREEICKMDLFNTRQFLFFSSPTDASCVQRSPLLPCRSILLLIMECRTSLQPPHSNHSDVQHLSLINWINIDFPCFEDISERARLSLSFSLLTSISYVDDTKQMKMSLLLPSIISAHRSSLPSFFLSQMLPVRSSHLN